MKLSILILTYNRLKITFQCLENIFGRVNNVNFETLIWDNGSTDGTFDWLAQYSHTNKNISFVHSSSKNYGVEAINFLARKAKGEFILKIDDDIEPPINFASRMIQAFNAVNEPNLAFLSWDMPWKFGSFALRSGRKLYAGKNGKIVKINEKDSVLINYHPDKWLVNGACRLCKRETFFKIGGHPRGVKYGVDAMVSRAAAKHGYWIGYLHNDKEMLVHKGAHDTPEQRRFKNEELKKYGNPLHV